MARVITAQELHMFHQMERHLLRYLIYILGRDPIESILTVALWLWLEHFARLNLLPQISLLDNYTFQALANEALLCLHCLQHSDAGDPLSYSAPIPLTATLTQKKLTDLAFFNFRRFTIIAGIKNLLNNVCSRIFTDILSDVYRIAGPTSFTGPPTPVMVPGFPHAVYGPFRPNRPEWDLRDDRFWYDRWWTPSSDVLDYDKAVFLTSSEGFSVTVEDVSCLFWAMFGQNRVVEILMGSMLGEQRALREEALYATVVMDSVVTVDLILNGWRLVKYKINGKDIWARKYQHWRV